MRWNTVGGCSQIYPTFIIIALYVSVVVCVFACARANATYNSHTNNNKNLYIQYIHLLSNWSRTYWLCWCAYMLYVENIYFWIWKAIKVLDGGGNRITNVFWHIIYFHFLHMIMGNSDGDTTPTRWLLTEYNTHSYYIGWNVFGRYWKAL